jgi:hypothetical protein
MITTKHTKYTKSEFDTEVAEAGKRAQSSASD